MKHDSRTSVLFDRRNIDLNTFYSQTNFLVEDQVTIHAINLHPEDVITFEVIYLKSGSLPEACGCYIHPGEMPATIGSTPLLCDECDEDGVKTPVRLTVHNPVVILDAPQGVIMRAVYEGTGIGESTVWAVSGTETQDLSPAMRGCPTTCCVPDPESWKLTGNRFCNADTGMVEDQYINNCGTTEWRETKEIEWIPTGQKTCAQDWDHEAGEPGTTTVQEVNDCGETRWVEGEPQRWTTTGAIRCADDEETIELQIVNDCGDLDWIPEDEQNWVATGQIECNRDWDLANDEPGTISIQEVNQCGYLRWVEGEDQRWTATGVTRCPTGNEEDRELQVVNDCGHIDWIVEADQTWTPTGKIRCNDDHVIEEGLMVEPGTKDREEVNQCGYIRWEEDGQQQWVETGSLRCVPGSEEETLQQLVNNCGDTLWVEGPEQEWTDTGVTRCEEKLVQRQQVNQCGLIRWIDTEEHCGYFATFRLPCEGLAYHPGQQPPDATVELKDCDGNVLAYLYAEPREGATTAVEEGCESTCGNGPVIGFAVDGVHANCGKTTVTLDDYVRIGAMPTLNINAPELEVYLKGILRALNKIAGE